MENQQLCIEKGNDFLMYQIGDKITTDVQGQIKDAQIVKIEKIFRETDENGDFVEHGLVILEEAIPAIPLPYEYHKDVIIIHYPESKIEENNDSNQVVYVVKTTPIRYKLRIIKL